MGFRAGVEAIHNNTQNAFFGVIMSVCPEASFYEVNRYGPPSDCIGISSIDFESTINTIKFNDGEYVFKNIKENPSLSLIFDVKMYLPGKNSFDNFGFSVFPLFSNIMDYVTKIPELYVNSGIYSLPIYEGTPSPDFIANLKTAKNIEAFLNRSIEMA